MNYRPHPTPLISRHLPILAGLATAFLGWKEPLRAQVINFNVPGGLSAANFSGQGAYADAGGNYWNPIRYQGTTSAGLLSDGVTASPITLTDTSPSYYGSQGAQGTVAGLEAPFCLENDGRVVTETLNHVPAGVYDLYLYGKNDNGLDGNRGTVFTVSVGGKSYGTRSTVNSVDSSFTQGNDYVLFGNLIVGAEGAITFTYTANMGVAGNTEGDFNGLQLVPGGFLPPRQTGSVLNLTNGNVRLAYDLSTGRANFYWANALKISGFYAGVALNSDADAQTNYLTTAWYTNHSWSVSGNTVTVTSSSGSYPVLKQTFILDQTDSFLTRVEATGTGLLSRWMGAVVVDTTGGVDVGSYSDSRALIVPYDNDSFTFNYNAEPMNNTGSSYEVSAFYDNTSRNGLVVGSVTHDTWKTGVYFVGANNKLNTLNVFGGITSSDTRDLMPHGLVRGNTVASPTVFVGFGADWRQVMEAYADANAAQAPKLPWAGGVPFGWNSGGGYTNMLAVSSIIKTNLQAANFNDQGVVYLNMDANGLSDEQALLAFTSYCHSNGQKAGCYMGPFIYWNTAAAGSNSFITGSTYYTWSSAYLRDRNGNPMTDPNGAIVLDGTSPAARQMNHYVMNYYAGHGFDFVKMDFLSEGAMEGVHYDTNITTGIQAFNQAMQYIVQENRGRMFLSESIAPIFPYQYAHSRRIYCDANSTINDTKNTMQSVHYGWWLNGRLYQFSDPDTMRFAGVTANENQSRLINCAISGTLFLDSDNLESASALSLARLCLTNAAINEVARAGVGFRPVEGNTGTSPGPVLVRQDGNTWYVAAFNYSAGSVNQSLNLPRLGIAGTFTAVDLWSGATSTVSGTSWSVSLGAKQARLFRLGSGPASVVGPVSQTTCVGGTVTFSTQVSGAPPFGYVWKKNGAVLGGANINALTLRGVALSDAGSYTVEVTGGNGSATNSAALTVIPTPLKWAAGNADWNSTSPPPWKDSTGAGAVCSDGAALIMDDTASGSSPVTVTVNQWVAPGSLTVSNATKDYTIQGAGGLAGAATALIKSGAGTLVLANGNSYSGSTTINAGTVQIGDGGTNGTLGTGYVTNNATLVFNRSDDYALPAMTDPNLSLHGGPGTLKQIGAGKLIFHYQHMFCTWKGAPNQGLYIGPGSTAETTDYQPVGLVTLNGGTLCSGGGNSPPFESWVLCGGVTVLSNAQTAVLTNSNYANNYTGMELRDNTVFNVAAGATNGVALLVAAVLTDSWSDYTNWGTLVKSGSGTMVLASNNLYQGETIISGGTLLLRSSGSIGPSGSAVTVQSGGHFGGAGTIKRNLNVQSGGYLEPGNDAGGVGTMTVTGNLTLAGTTVVKLSRPANDMFSVSNALIFGGTLRVTNVGAALAAGDSFKVFSKPGVGTFSTLILPALGSGLGWTNRLTVDGTLAVVRTVSLAPASLALQSSRTGLVLNWATDHKGWHLQVQTNPFNTGLGTDWWTIAGSDVTNCWLLPLDTTNPSVFFRLSYP